MNPEIEVLIASYPHREDLVAEIFVDGWQFAELRLEDGEVLVELYENNNDIWRFRFGDLTKALQDAELRLRAVYPDGDESTTAEDVDAEVRDGGLGQGVGRKDSGDL